MNDLTTVLAAHRPISLVPNKRPSKSSRVIKPKSMALPTNSQSLPSNILIAPLQAKKEIWASSRKARCSDHSKKRRYALRLEKSVTLSRLTVVSTSSTEQGNCLAHTPFLVPCVSHSNDLYWKSNTNILTHYPRNHFQQPPWLSEMIPVRRTCSRVQYNST